jgi:hypothetical protein
MKTRVHAGHERRTAGGAGRVVGAGNTRAGAARLAQQQVLEERARRDVEMDKDRRHQLDLLALQNDVNKTALATQASWAPAWPRPAPYGRWPAPVTACTAIRAPPGDRFCAPAAPAAGTGMMQTAIDKMRELRALHEDGLLSRQEFDSRKNAILDAAYAPPADGSGRGRAVALRRRRRRGTEIGLMAGQEVGPFERRYRLERLIAHGGMGQVWQATDLATQAELGHSAQVALKILPPQLTQQHGPRAPADRGSGARAPAGPRAHRAGLRLGPGPGHVQLLHHHGMPGGRGPRQPAGARGPAGLERGWRCCGRWPRRSICLGAPPAGAPRHQAGNVFLTRAARSSCSTSASPRAPRQPAARALEAPASSGTAATARRRRAQGQAAPARGWTCTRWRP